MRGFNANLTHFWAIGQFDACVYIIMGIFCCHTVLFFQFVEIQLKENEFAHPYVQFNKAIPFQLLTLSIRQFLSDSKYGELFSYGQYILLATTTMLLTQTHTNERTNNTHTHTHSPWRLIFDNKFTIKDLKVLNIPHSYHCMDALIHVCGIGILLTTHHNRHNRSVHQSVPENILE